MSETLAAFVLTCIAVELTPGPNMAYLALLSAERGRMAGLAATAGVALGLAVLGAVAGIGFGTLVTSQPFIYQTVRWAGVGFLLYLAWDNWRDASRPLDETVEARSALGYFNRGLVTNLLNP